MIGGWFKILKCIRLRNEVDGEGGGSKILSVYREGMYEYNNLNKYISMGIICRLL